MGKYGNLKAKYSKLGGLQEDRLVRYRSLKAFERDVHYLIDQFVIKVCCGYELSLKSFVDTWASINFTFMLRVCCVQLEFRTYIQLLYASALDRLTNPSPLNSFAFVSKQITQKQKTLFECSGKQQQEAQNAGTEKEWQDSCQTKRRRSDLEESQCGDNQQKYQIPFLFRVQQRTEKTQFDFGDLQKQGMDIVDVSSKQSWEQIKYINQVAAIFCLFCLWGCQERIQDNDDKRYNISMQLLNARKQNKLQKIKVKQLHQDEAEEQEQIFSGRKKKFSKLKQVQLNGKRSRNEFEPVSGSGLEELDYPADRSSKRQKRKHNCVKQEFAEAGRISICLSANDVKGLVQVIEGSQKRQNSEILRLLGHMRKKNAFIYSLAERPAGGQRYRCGTKNHILFPSRRKLENNTMQQTQQHLVNTEEKLAAVAADVMHHADKYIHLRNNFLKNSLHFSQSQIRNISLVQQDDQHKLSQKLMSFKQSMQGELDLSRKKLRSVYRQCLQSSRRKPDEVKYKTFQQCSRAFEENKEEPSSSSSSVSSASASSDEDEECQKFGEDDDDNMFNWSDFDQMGAGGWNEFGKCSVVRNGLQVDGVAVNDMDEEEAQVDAVHSFVPGGESTINRVITRSLEQQQKFGRKIQYWVDAIEKPK